VPFVTSWRPLLSPLSSRQTGFSAQQPRVDAEQIGRAARRFRFSTRFFARALKQRGVSADNNNADAPLRHFLFAI
jgi:hypothetical protein